MSAHLSSADTAWLHMDRPTNLLVINSVLLFEEPVDWALFKQITQERLVDRYPRFRQRVVESRLPLRPPKWEDDPDFSLEHHLHHLALPAPGDAAALQELVGDLMTMPLDRNRPLWHTYMVDGLGDGAAVITPNASLHRRRDLPRAGDDVADGRRAGCASPPGAGAGAQWPERPPRGRHQPRERSGRGGIVRGPASRSDRHLPLARGEPRGCDRA